MHMPGGPGQVELSGTEAQERVVIVGGDFRYGGVADETGG